MHSISLIYFLWPGPKDWSAASQTWLADEEADVVSENRSVSIQEVASQIDHNWQFSQLL